MIALISHPACELHAMGDRHPEQPARLRAIRERLREHQLDTLLQKHEAPLVSDAQLLAAHPAEYVEQVTRSAPAEGLVALDPDTRMNPHSLEAARRAAGAAVHAVDLVLGGEHQQAFCAVRPPGHHAERTRAMGFCIFGNVAIAALHAQQAHGIERVAIVDFDVHHGNGTEDIVAGREGILFFSTFQHPLYPDSGTGATAENVVNTPLPAGTDGSGIRDAVTREWLPRLAAFQPQLLLVSAGFDAHRADPLAQLELENADYHWLGKTLTGVAAEHCGGRMITALEGGYDLDALAASVEAFLRGCRGEPWVG